MAESYLYNPTETINKGFANVQANIANMFSGIIAQKQNDYNLAEKTFENIDALTDKLGEYGQEEIVSKTQGLLDDAAKSIIKNGKLDYSELGRIRNGVSAIKNRKSALEAGTQMYKEMAQTALATKDDLLSLSATLGDMKNILLNPNNLSAEDMGKQMQSVYQKNINTTKLAGDVLNRIAPATEYDMTYTKDGAEKRIAGTKVAGFNYDPSTGKWSAPTPTVITNPDGTTTTQSYDQSLVDKIKQQAPTLLSSIKAQMGDHGIMQTDEQLLAPYIQTYLQTKNTASKDIEVKSKAQIDTENITAKAKGIELANLPTKIFLENERDRASIRASNASTAKSQAELDMLQSGGGQDSVDINKETNTKTGFLGKKIPLTAKDEQGKSVNMAVNSVQWINGKEYYVGYQLPKTMGYVEMNQAALSGLQEVKVPVNSYNKTQLNTNIGTATKKDIPYIRKNIASYEATPMEVRQQGFSSGQMDMSTKTLYLSRDYMKKNYNQIAKDHGAKHVKWVD